jgi:hypothetical protein
MTLVSLIRVKRIDKSGEQAWCEVGELSILCLCLWRIAPGKKSIWSCWLLRETLMCIDLLLVKEQSLCHDMNILDMVMSYI